MGRLITAEKQSQKTCLNDFSSDYGKVREYTHGSFYFVKKQEDEKNEIRKDYSGN
jgi:hypothetical protein